jgi:hypothetical protein
MDKANFTNLFTAFGGEIVNSHNFFEVVIAASNHDFILLFLK